MQTTGNENGFPVLFGLVTGAHTQGENVSTLVRLPNVDETRY